MDIIINKKSFMVVLLSLLLLLSFVDNEWREKRKDGVWFLECVKRCRFE
jgi:hypothetical protein